LSLALTGCGLVGGFGIRATEEWSRSYDLATGGRLELSNINGRIEAEPSAGRLEVRAEIIARGASRRSARRLLQRVEIEEQASPERVRLETKHPGLSFLSGGVEVRYQVRIPAGCAAELKTTNGSITLTGLSDPVSLRTVNGRISASALGGAVEARTTNGSIELEVDQISASGIELETVNGSIRLRLPSQAAARLSARVINGSIDVDLPRAQVEHSSRRRVEALLGGGGAALELRTVNGSIRVGASAPGPEREPEGS
jgi:hypothetical protein